MDERARKAFDFAAEAAKQIITLSTGIIALTVTFLKDVLQEPGAHTWALRVAWLLYLAAIVFGLWTLLSLTGSLGDEKVPDDQLTIYSWNARFPMFLQLVAFVGAIVLTVWFGWAQL